jgi:outer membrane protein TolC
MKLLLTTMRVTVFVALATLSALPSLSARTLTIEEARRLALEFNRDYLQSKEGVRVADANVTIARAGALPEIRLGSSYNRNFDIPSFFVQMTNADGVTESMEFKTGFKNSYSANLSLVQPIWQGGKVFTAYSIARDFRKYSLAVQSQVSATVAYNSDVLFSDALLQRSKLDVLTKSHEAASQNLDVVEKQFSQGLVSEFEVLRARVEKSNLDPQILRAESDQKLAEKRLQSFLGIDLDEEIQLIEEQVNPAIAGLPPLDTMVQRALDNRPEMQQRTYERDMRRKAIKIAQSEYWPSLDAVAGYGWQAQSDEFTLSKNISRSWTAGLTLSVPIFQGGRTRGAVTQAMAEHNQALLAVEQTRDNIRLEVEQAYDRLLQAKRSLEIQQNTIAMAEEGLRIANLRYQSGVGTLLEVLSAQAALTQTREILAEATFAFRTARSGLKLATTIDVDNL